MKKARLTECSFCTKIPSRTNIRSLAAYTYHIFTAFLKKQKDQTADKLHK